MVLLPGCSCCGNCTQLAQAFRNAAAVQLDFSASSISVPRSGKLSEACSPYASGHDFSGYWSFRGADYSGTFLLTKIYNAISTTTFYSAFAYVWDFGLGGNNPYLQLDAFGTVSAGTPTLTTVLVGFPVAGVAKIDRASASTSAPVSYTSSLTSASCSGTDSASVRQQRFSLVPDGYDVASGVMPGSLGNDFAKAFSCSESFSLSQIADSPQAQVEFITPALGWPPGSQGSSIGYWTDVPVTFPFSYSLPVNFSYGNLVIP